LRCCRANKALIKLTQQTTYSCNAHAHMLNHSSTHTSIYIYIYDQQCGRVCGQQSKQFQRVLLFSPISIHLAAAWFLYIIACRCCVCNIFLADVAALKNISYFVWNSLCYSLRFLKFLWLKTLVFLLLQIKIRFLKFLF